MTQTGSPTRGDILNKHQLTDVVVLGVNTSTAIVAGALVYKNGATGLVIVPTATTRPDASRIRFLEVAVDNTAAGATIATKEAETFKHGARVVGQCDGAITINAAVRASRTTAGRFQALPDPATGAAASAIANYLRERLGIYLGHVGEIEETGNEPTDAADADLVVVQMD